MTRPAARAQPDADRGSGASFSPLSPSRERDLVLAAIALAVLAWYVSRTAVQLLHGYPASDFRNYYVAAQDFAAGRDVYAQALRCCNGVVRNDGFNYPPLIAELVRPLTVLSLTAAARVWLVLNQLMLAGAIFLAWRTLRDHVSTGALLLLLSLTLAFRPLSVAIELAQVTVLLTLLLAVAAYSYARRREAALGGVAVAIATLIKLLPVVMALAFVRWDRRPRFLVGAATLAATTVVVLGTLWVLTPATQEFFFRVMVRFTSTPDIYGNQSLQAVSRRAQIVLLGGVGPAGRVLTALAMLALIGLTWWRGARVEGAVGRLAVFASLLAVIPLVSPLTWDHHLVTEMLVVALIAPGLAPRSGRWWLVVAAYPLLWLPAVPWILVSDSLHAPRVVTILLGGSMPTLGELLLWLACLRCLRTGQETLPREP
ncbi:MAG TPA: glycosyltransferase 87 family protein [Candidatus Dormibacteraeota bacterium]|nr:glycosyltransferase 87 family protein [Candidatus Dormibacteraeota bacterium]